MPSRRDLLIGAIVLIAAFAAARAWLGRAPEPAPAPRIGVAPDDGPGIDDDEERPSAEALRNAAVRREQAQQIRENKNAAKAAQYRRRALFPPTSGPIEDGLDPVQGSRIPEMARSGDPDDPGPALITFPATTAFEAPQEAVLYAEVVEREERQPGQRGDLQEIRIDPAAITGVVRDPSGAVAATLAFADGGRNGDAEAGDRLFTATFAPDPERAAEVEGAFVVDVTAQTTGGDQLVATTGFAYAVPSARLTGRYRDAVVDGHLRIEAEVEVDEPGEYELQGTLASADAVMLASARHRATLEAGKAWVPLTFWGLILREHGVDGPYNLFSVSIATLREGGAAAGDVVGNAHNTAPYRVTEFSDLPFNDPELLERAARLEQAAPARPN